MCYLQVKHTVNKEQEVKIRAINKLNTKNVVSVPHGPHGGMDLKEKTETEVKNKCCSELYFFLFSPRVSACRKLMLRADEANSNG